MKRASSIVLACALLALVTAPAGADLVQNGSFEAGSSFGSGFITLNAGASDIDNWTVIGGGINVIDYIGGYWQASNGVRSLDLNGNPGPGGVEQEIDTILENTYLVTFDMAGNPDNQATGPLVKTLKVSAIGGGQTQSQDYSFDVSGKTKSVMGWETMQFVFTAKADTTLLRFESTVDGSPYGPALDNIGVSMVPVPGAVLLGMLGLGVAGAKIRKQK